MELSIQVNPQERAVRLREVHALAAGDVYNPVTLLNVEGAQTAALQLKLFKDSAATEMLAQCSSFVEVSGHRSMRRGVLTLATQAMKTWYESLANDATATDTNGMPSALVNAWLVIADSTKVWAACNVPLILRAMDTNVVQGADGISPTVSVTKSGSVTTISITDVNGTHTETVNDGQDGADGESPTMLVDKNPSTGNTRITVVNVDGSTSSQDVEVESVVASVCEGINLKPNATARDMLTCLQSVLLRLGGTVASILVSVLCLADPPAGMAPFGDLGMDVNVVTNADQATAQARSADRTAVSNAVSDLRRDLTNGTAVVSNACHATSADNAATLGARTYTTILGDMTNAAKAVRDSTTFVATESDPTVHAWAKAAAKPAYTAVEVGAVAKTGGVYQATKFFHLRPKLAVGTWNASIPPFNMSGGGTGNAFVFGDNLQTKAPDTMTLGVGALNTNNYSFVWNGDANRIYQPNYPSMSNPYPSRYNGGFHVNPSVRTGMTTPLENFWIGDLNLATWIANLAPAPDFSTGNSVLVGTIQSSAPRTSLAPATGYVDRVSGALSERIAGVEAQVGAKPDMWQDVNVGTSPAAGTSNDVWVCDLDGTVLRRSGAPYYNGVATYTTWTGTNFGASALWRAGSDTASPGLVTQVLYTVMETVASGSPATYDVSVQDGVTGEIAYIPIVYDGDPDGLYPNWTRAATNGVLTAYFDIPPNRFAAPVRLTRYGSAELTKVPLVRRNELDEALASGVTRESVTNVVRSVVSVTSLYVWDAQDSCLYRREMEGGYLYWTPVTNVNALLPENAHILEYLEAHRND